jgi:gliding motility-associated-like protein
MCRRIFFLGLLITKVFFTGAQVCTLPGQTPASAVLICGTSTFNVTTPAFCGQTNIPVPCSDGYTYQNVNPNFFRMACYTSGTLGFSILPTDPAANYNWQLFDVTNTNPSDIFINPGLFVACNWSGDLGETGASIDGPNLIVCSGAQPLFSKMPTLAQGHTYMLMVCNQSNSAANYQLTIDGGSAVITDPVEPKMQYVRTNCNATEVLVKLNKPIKCNSLAADGSDFTVSGGATVIAATTGDCTSQFGSDSVFLTLSNPLANGTQIVTIHNGTDGNTLTDACGRNISEADNISFIVAAPQPTPMDSIKPLACAPKYVELVFKKPINCNSIAADGSDFIFTGPQSVTVSPAAGTCNAGNSNSIIKLNLSSSSITPGIYRLQLTTGTDGNTLIDECGLPVASGGGIVFNVYPPVSAKYTYNIAQSCKETPVSFFHDGNNNSTTWNWNFGNGLFSSGQNPVYTFTNGGNHTVKLIVSNGSCSDTTAQTITTAGALKAAFNLPLQVCPGDTVHFENKSTGNITNWQWSFGNGATSNLQIPSGVLYTNSSEKEYTIRLIAGNSISGCSDTATKIIKALINCTVAVPSAFTPNGDNKNDFLYPLNAVSIRNLYFRVYSRTGQLVFETRNPLKKWDGKINGQPQQTGVYIWLLIYDEPGTGKNILQKGTVLLMR